MADAWVTIYCDGACWNNPGPSAYGVILEYKGHKKEISGRLGKMTNNMAELWAAIKGLQALKKKGQFVAIYSDSQYVVQGARKEWEIVTNLALWSLLEIEIDKHQEVIFNWIPRKNNVEADSLARLELQRMNHGIQKE